MTEHMPLIVGKLCTPCHEMYLADRPDSMDYVSSYWPDHVLIYLGRNETLSEQGRSWHEFLNYDGIIVGGFFCDHLDIGLRLL